jgi:hypothetical protein
MHPKDPSALWLGPMHWFSDWPVGEVPQAGSLVYTIWDRDGLFVYVGISGRSQGQSSRSKGPLGRLASHASGRRSGDQFLIYVCDRLVLPRLGNRIPEIADGALSLDAETKAYVRANLGFRWLAVDGPGSAFALERSLQAGDYDPPGSPLLNPVRPKGTRQDPHERRHRYLGLPGGEGPRL